VAFIHAASLGAYGSVCQLSAPKKFASIMMLITQRLASEPALPID